MKKNLVLAGALVGLGSPVIAQAGGSSSAESASFPENVTVIKCLGVSKAGKNDCGSTDGRHDCSGAATKDLDPTEWVYLPEGPLCDKLGGKKLMKDGKVVQKTKPSSKFFGG